MKKLKIDLTNCHGIHRLDSEISFKDARAAAIYAPNGLMKTSFARTFGDLSRGVDSSDHLFPERASSRNITDQDGVAVDPSQVVVIVSYDEEMGPTEETSTLLVDQVLRDEYERLQRGINEARADLVAALKIQSSTKKDVAREVSLAFTRDDQSFFRSLLRVEEELQDEEARYAELPYDTLFDDKVLALLATKDFAETLADYVQRFNELLDASTYFSRDTFSYYNAETVARSLGANGFFDANHTVILHDGSGGTTVGSQKELADLINSEKDRISEDAALRKTFAAIEAKLTRNAEVRRFWDFISENQAILPELVNVDRFKERVWKSYLKANEGLYSEAVARFRGAEVRKKEIQAAAAGQRGQWEEVIEIFNRRFFVPFTLTAKNRTNVVLGLDAVAKLGFEFEDGGESVEVERDDLLEVLSTGEKKALYILNVLFEVERRKNQPGETIFIVDDIADSFDYKNKYAIIQYLKDIADVDNFRLVVLTHNFDFYRTLESRFIPYSQCLMAQKTEQGVALVRAAGIKNPFIKDFKPNFFVDPGKRVAAIPFIRNLLEYTRGEDDPDYVKLTSLLHWKADTASITQSDLDAIFNSLFETSEQWRDPNGAVIEMITDQADACVGDSTSLNLSNKITLSIAIRLEAEKHMVEAINDPEFLDGVRANQTPQLLARYKKDFPSELVAIRAIDGVVLMTPEHIHVNSFMYEPILDMSDEHLARLLAEVKALGS
ncbi:AAA family ATPase [Microbacterium sp. zg.Y1084]|uniref:AAA family ATPase n=1 Tax=Microbacterium sp. zg.Y1084 TaxID=2969667 RepID=UPI00214B320B|nr:AAA family ATPase [Microbacterium sp. zg.Y1084]MCR2812792.1 AAA family ATPase [Microbacterium sp. zg.Y1084]